MVKVYILPVERIGNTDTVRGIQFIRNGFLIYDAGRATLVQDTTPEEDAALSALALEMREPTEQEKSRIEALLAEPLPEPARDLTAEIVDLKARVEKLENK